MITFNFTQSSRSIATNTAMHFDGVDEFIDVPNVAAIETDMNLPHTYSFWLNFDATSGGVKCAMSQRAGFKLIQFIPTSASSFDIIVKLAQGANRIQKDDTITGNCLNWNHYVFTYDGTKLAGGMTAYFNGVDAALTITDTETITDDPIDIELSYGDRSSETLFVDGLMVHGMMFTKELSSTEVELLYNNGTPPDPTIFMAAADFGCWHKLGDGDATGSGNVVSQINTVPGTMTNMEAGDLDSTDLP